MYIQPRTAGVSAGSFEFGFFNNDQQCSSEPIVKTRRSSYSSSAQKGAAMANQKVYLIVDLTINEGKLSNFESMVQTMIAGAQKEPGTLGYDWFLSKDRKQCRLIETYADANALFAHVNGAVVQELVPKLLESSSLVSFKVYGDPGAKASEILVKVGAEIFPPFHGLSR
jgi:quinol monooxygenase YgiN